MPANENFDFFEIDLKSWAFIIGGSHMTFKFKLLKFQPKLTKI